MEHNSDTGQMREEIKINVIHGSDRKVMGGMEETKAKQSPMVLS